MYIWINYPNDGKLLPKILLSKQKEIWLWMDDSQIILERSCKERDKRLPRMIFTVYTY